MRRVLRQETDLRECFRELRQIGKGPEFLVPQTAFDDLLNFGRDTKLGTRTAKIRGDWLSREQSAEQGAQLIEVNRLRRKCQPGFFQHPPRGGKLRGESLEGQAS